MRTLRAPNPSLMTLSGTNTYLIDAGAGEALCIDPGPENSEHIARILDSAGRAKLRLSTILITHGHPDHAPGAVELAAKSGAAVFAHPSAAFPHERVLHDGEELSFSNATVTCIAAPGHARDHLVFYLREEETLFTGDVIVGEGTVVIAPPGGVMRDYQRTLRRLLAEYGGAHRILGGHGDPVVAARAKIEEYIAHREMRERQIIELLGAGSRTIPELVREVYVQVDRRLWPAAARQTLAYLLALEDENIVRSAALGRAPSANEAAILNPDWSALVDSGSAEVAAAELGTWARVELLGYQLV